MTALTDAIAQWEYPKTSLVRWVYTVFADDIAPASSGGILEITVMTTDTYPPHNPVQIGHRYSIPPQAHRDQEYALAFLRQCTRSTVVHEMDEQIRVGGVMVFDPHRDDHPGEGKA